MAHKFGVLREDDDEHWYLIPEDMTADFDATLAAIYDAEGYSDEWYCATEYFLMTFRRYRLVGGVADLRIIMGEQDE